MRHAPRKGATGLRALRNLLTEAETILATTTLPQGRAERAHELLRAALALTDDLLKVNPAAVLGEKGGRKTAERGPDYFRKIAAKRKTRAGGRPRKQQN
ncbi:MAG TPA: hypothetical protein VFL57_01720 [Bryobacteraceae bacterium]|nr:hypothetical protein [Bryobacteraceae bacterium]